MVEMLILFFTCFLVGILIGGAINLFEWLILRYKGVDENDEF
jgi:hypothetical protein